MSIIHKPRKRFLRFVGVGAVVVFGILSTLGSGGGGDGGSSGGGGGGTSVTAFNFNASNSLTAAQYAASVLAFFPDYNQIALGVLDTLTSSNPSNSPFDLAGCSNVSGPTLSWNDVDSSGDLSAGDTATLDFNNCDLDGGGSFVTGTLGITVNSASFGALPNSFDVTVSINLTIITGSDTSVIAGSFGHTATTTNGTDFTSTYSGTDSSNQVVTDTENGSVLFKFGCFSVTQTFNVGSSSSYGLTASGVINASNAILSLASGASLSFVSDQLESGTQRLLSLANPSCANLDVGSGVSDSDGSYIDMEALGGGSVRLHTYDSSDVEFNTINTTWDALRN